MTDDHLVFNPPPGWPKPPDGWVPPRGWTPDPAWPDPPEGWQLWLPGGAREETTPDNNASTPASDAVSKGAPVAETVVSSETSRRIAILEGENAALRAQLEAATAGSDVVVLDDEWILQEVGVYRYHHPLENAAAYKERLDKIGIRTAELVKSNSAIEMSNSFAFDNSLAKGQRMASDLGKLMLRAYNAEVDNSLRSLRAGNAVTAKRRVEASRAAIKKLGSMMQMQISDAFHALRLSEVELTADFLMKKQEEREAALEERARLREERKVEAELTAERERLSKERSHLQNALDALQRVGSSDPDLERKLADIDDAIVQNDYRAANIRAGYVYVISNRGAFGVNVVKIGLTRRLEPLDRVNELGGASVPFPFDVHALFFSEDAVTLEAELHQHFAGR
ncbi:MAG: DUF4041 domain-containing protein, partial [Actinomycetota bacterium]|nr:DUF4041 domain-containing protein [Actinomycetota bacterium]